MSIIEVASYSTIPEVKTGPPAREIVLNADLTRALGLG